MAPTLDEINDIIQTFGPIMRIHPDEKYLMDDPDLFLSTSQCRLNFGLVSNENDYDSFGENDLGTVGVSSGGSLLDAVSLAKADPRASDPSFRYWLQIDDAFTAPC